MDEQHALGSIDAATFDALLRQYPSVVPEKLAALEKQRLEVIPQAIKGRESAYITKDELATLMDWKLAHGTFRPTLQKLIQQNDFQLVQETTKQSFELYSSNPSDPPTDARVKPTIALLSKLKGVGPATATLLLSLYDPVNIPFFSDELFRWAMWDLPATAKGSGWKREIKYTVKEYLQMYAKVRQLKDRLRSESTGYDMSALDIEKVAYVLGKQTQAGIQPPPAAAKSDKRKASANHRHDSDEELPASALDNPALAAFARNFEVSLLGEERVAEMDREEAEDMAASEALSRDPAYQQLAAAVEGAFGGDVSDEDGIDEAAGQDPPEQPVKKRQKRGGKK